MAHLVYIGHVAKDVIIVEDQIQNVAGGGVYYGSIAGSTLGNNVTVFTKCASDDKSLFISEMSDRFHHLDLIFLDDNFNSISESSEIESDASVKTNQITTSNTRSLPNDLPINNDQKITNQNHESKKRISSFSSSSSSSSSLGTKSPPPPSMSSSSLSSASEASRSKSTCFTNIYSNHDSDERIQKVTHIAESFTYADIEYAAEYFMSKKLLPDLLSESSLRKKRNDSKTLKESVAVILSPLTRNEFPEELVKEIKPLFQSAFQSCFNINDNDSNNDSNNDNLILDQELDVYVVADIQGWIRSVSEEEESIVPVWKDKTVAMLKYIDVLKVDDKEINIMTGYDFNHFDEGMIQIQKLLAPNHGTVLATFQRGAKAYNGQEMVEAHFGRNYTAQGRTGRGDTCTTAFISQLMSNGSFKDALNTAVNITAIKMMHPGPLINLDNS